MALNIAPEITICIKKWSKLNVKATNLNDSLNLDLPIGEVSNETISFDWCRTCSKLLLYQYKEQKPKSIQYGFRWKHPQSRYSGLLGLVGNFLFRLSKWDNLNEF